VRRGRILRKNSHQEEIERLRKSVRQTRRDRDLQIARRLDWRFLLPDPRLRRVRGDHAECATSEDNPGRE
jgi:hypothetical protein